MNPIGKWKVKQVLRFSPENGLEWQTLEELEAQGVDEDDLSMYRNSVMIFHENGTAENLMTLPDDFTQEQMEEVVAEGKEIRDGMMVLDCKEWKTENGKICTTRGTRAKCWEKRFLRGLSFRKSMI